MYQLARLNDIFSCRFPGKGATRKTLMGDVEGGSEAVAIL